MSLRGVWTIALLGAAGLFWMMPLFHIVPLKQAEAAKAKAAFNPADYAARFWSEQLTPTFPKAADAQIVLESLAKDAKSAVTNFGRTVGVGDMIYFFMRGTGTVVSVEARGVGVSLNGAGAEADMLIKTGLLFGNTVRDATGLLNASEFPNSHDFNDVSTELNRIVESRVISQLKTNAVVGRTIRFAVCAEVSEDDAGGRPLKVVLVHVEFLK